MTRSAFRFTALALALSLALAAGCASRTRRPAAPTPPPLPVVSIMGPSRLTTTELTAWFEARRGSRQASRASVPLDTLARFYVEEGNAEGVAGDLAFVQAVLETGWFAFPGLVSPGQNNFAGIGASDDHPAPATFPDARTGVRAQIQHLRAYADPGAQACASPPLRHPCVDPRFQLVVPKGKARSWNEMGGGNWAASPDYGSTIVRLYRDALTHAGKPLEQGREP